MPAAAPLLVLLLALLLPARGHAQEARLEDGWRFHTGDDPAWASPAFDDASWTPAADAAAWERYAPDYDGFGWYRREVELPAGLEGEPVGLLFAVVGDAYQLFWNGRLVATHGSLPPDEFRETPDPTVVLIPDSLLALRPEGPHLLALRVYNDYAYGGLLGEVWVGPYADLAAWRPPGGTAIAALLAFFVTIGVYHLLFWARRPRVRENLHFAALCGLMAVYGAPYHGGVVEALLPYVNPFRLLLIALLLAGPVYLGLVRRLFELPRSRVERGVVAMLLLFAAVAAVLPLRRLAELSPWIDAGLIAGLAALVVRAAFVAGPRLGHAPLLLVGTGAFSFALTWDLLSEYGWVPVPELIPGVLGLFWAGFGVFAMTIGLTTADKWARTEATARVDPLTGLARRHVFEEVLHRETERQRRTGAPLAVVVIDLDYFKMINDTYGHRVGDQVLARVGRLLRHSTRNIDLATRLGGEELGVLLLDSDLAGAFRFAERFRKHLAGVRFPVESADLQVTASLGIAVGSGAVDADDLIDAADRMLYRAKSEGRDRTIGVDLTAGPDAPVRRSVP